MKKTIDFGKVDVYGNGRRDHLVRIEIELHVEKQHRRTIDLEEISEYHTLSICGEVWNRLHTDIISGGQCYDYLAELLPHNEDLHRIIAMWKRWHLNDLNPGTREQREIAGNLPYTEALETLGKAGLVIDREYKYGTRWLVELLPQDVIDEILDW